MHSKAYNAIWNRITAGWFANDLASAIIHLLTHITSNQPDARHIIRWPASCAAQNRDKILAYALQLFIQKSPAITTITHRYWEPGHSTIQNVDKLHSNIEGGLKHTEMHSPVTLVKLLCKITPQGQPIYIHQMKAAEFFDYYALATDGIGFDSARFSTMRETAYTSASIKDVTVKQQRFGDPQTYIVLQTHHTLSRLIKPLQKRSHARIGLQPWHKKVARN